MAKPKKKKSKVPPTFSEKAARKTKVREHTRIVGQKPSIEILGGKMPEQRRKSQIVTAHPVPGGVEVRTQHK